MPHLHQANDEEAMQSSMKPLDRLLAPNFEITLVRPPLLKNRGAPTGEDHLLLRSRSLTLTSTVPATSMDGLGSGLIDHIRKITVAAMQIADMKGGLKFEVQHPAG